jgi:hypothetical protein
MLIEGNVVFNNGAIAAGANGSRANNLVLAGGGGVRGLRVLNNYFFHTPRTNLGYNELGWGGNNQDLIAQGNYFMGGFQAVAIGNWQSINFQKNHVYSKAKYNVMFSGSSQGHGWDHNTYYGSGLFQINGSGSDFNGWKAKSGTDTNSTFRSGDPAGVWTFVVPNKYEQGRANIVIYNWDQVASVQVDLSGVITKGQRFQIRDAQNFLGPALITGTFDGSTVQIPMTGFAVAQPNGNVPNPPRHTELQFGTYVLLPL